LPVTTRNHGRNDGRDACPTCDRAVNDLVALGLIVVALYLSECVVWARHGAFVVTAPFLFGAKMHVLSRLAGTTRGAFTPLNPLPPFGRVYVVEPLPFTLDVDRAIARRAFSLAHEPLPDDTGREVTWADVKDVRAIDRDVHVSGAVFARCSTPRHARVAASVLATVAAATPHKRAEAIEEAMRAHFDVAEARARARRHARWSVPLLVSASAVFLALFVFVPRVVVATGTKHWPFLVVSVYAWVLVCAVSMYVAHRKLTPDARGERWMHTLLMLPAPTMAMRGNDKLGRALMAGLHPVAVALGVLHGEARDDVVGRALRELKHPRGGRARDARDEALLARVTTLARTEGVDVDNAFSAPTSLRAGQSAWCPRCRAVYRDGTTTCADCTIALV
jgi:hypothetical protein